MIAATALLFFAANSPIILQDQSAVRSGCSADDSLVARLPAGTPVQIRFSMAGSGQPCYKIQAMLQGKEVAGYVPASALANVSTFDEARREGAGLGALSHWAETQVQSLAKPAGPPGLIPNALALLEQQPAEALRMVEGALTLSRPPELLAVAGIAAYRADRLSDALAYLREAQSLRPDNQISGLIQRIEHEQKSDRSGEKLYGTRFVLRYDGTSLESSVAHSMVMALEQEYSRVSNVLGCNGTERITTIVQTPDAYRQSTGAAEWSGGQYDGKIRVALFEGKEMGASTRKAFAHEIVHACLATLGRYPAWLHEGLAQRMSGETMPRGEQDTIRALVKAGKLPRLSELGQNWSRFTPAQAGVAYRYGLDAVDTLFRLYEPIGVANVLRNPAMLQQATTAIEREMAR